MKEKSKMLCIRAFIVFFIAVSAFIAIMQYKSTNLLIAQMMGVSWGALAGSFLAPFLFALYWKRTTKASCWACFAFGSILMIVNMVARGSLPPIIRSPINCGVVAMLAGFVIVPLVSLFSKAPDRRFVDQLFSCYEKTRQVAAKSDLGA